jgi:6-pyruvoyl-tetrahydropterin synthase
MTAGLLTVRHNIEVAHRLYENKGKCEQIHGHSMWVTLKVMGELNPEGFIDGIEFGALKKDFRRFLDTYYDHHVLLNEKDPFASPLLTVARDENGKFTRDEDEVYLPGLFRVSGDPTTENIALWIGEEMQTLKYPVHSVEVQETAVNGAQVFF